MLGSEGMLMSIGGVGINQPPCHQEVAANNLGLLR
jgi:hypothetical protein